MLDDATFNQLKEVCKQAAWEAVGPFLVKDRQRKQQLIEALRRVQDDDIHYVLKLTDIASHLVNFIDDNEVGKAVDTIIDSFRRYTETP